MNARNLTYLFLALGIILAVFSIYLSLTPVSMKTYRVYTPYGIITSGFISGVCFFVAGMLARKTTV
jgi:hypothetical protein